VAAMQRNEAAIDAEFLQLSQITLSRIETLRVDAQ
jgi:hypothetical protein